jgi:tetratricopeptide (TPR) repeat protein
MDFRHLMLVVLLPLCVSHTFAGNPEDSLRKELLNPLDSIRAKAYLELGKYYAISKVKFDSAIVFVKAGLAISEQNQDIPRIIFSGIRIGTIYSYKGEHETCIEWYEKSLKLAEQSGDLRSQAEVLQKMGTVLSTMRESERSYECTMKAVKIFEKLGDAKGLAMAYYVISNYLRGKGQGSDRMYYMRKAIQSVEKTGPENAQSKVIIYKSASTLFSEMKAENPRNLDSCLYFLNLGMNLCKQYNLNRELPAFYPSLANYHLLKGNLITCIETCLNYTQLPKKLPREELTNLFVILSNAYKETEEYERSLRYLDSAKKYTPPDNLDSFGYLKKKEFELKKLMGNPEETLLALEQSAAAKDSIARVDKLSSLNDLREKYKSELKDDQILKLNQEKQIGDLQKWWLGTLIISGLLILLVIAVMFRLSVARAAMRQAEIEQRLNRSRMNPHFFFNVLTSLQAMALDGARSGETAGYLAKYARIMRQSLESTYTDVVPLEDELSFLRQYLDLQMMRFPGKFNYEFHIHPDLDPWEVLVPSMLLQPFVENSIEHGFKNLSGIGLLTVNLKPAANGIEITIHDNGMASSDSLSVKGHTGRATQIVTDRLYLLNKRFRSRAGFQIENGTGEGYTVTIQLPIIKE